MKLLQQHQLGNPPTGVRESKLDEVVLGKQKTLLAGSAAPLSINPHAITFAISRGGRTAN